ncbi:Kinase-like protein [Penicillium verhagenii]|uniref:Kinase-like protein n=1 Tax=Penicillium verhagenii TaxID=1562060 RepID=UPI0025458E00|nr:Kinase-like protein [Penicillium verhagenii]KAJ5918529.1 Kinase-like protein [Penicillium verhagenii]
MEPPMKYSPLMADNIENIERYQPGGFHPVLLGDTFADGRYVIIHKLGAGGFFTTWLTRDETLNIPIPAHASFPRTELHAHQLLQRSTCFSDQFARDHISQLLDHFEVSGPNGTHACLVTPVAGPSIYSLPRSPGQIAGTRRLGGRLAGAIAGQVTVDFSQWSTQEVYDNLGEPEISEITLYGGEQAGPYAPRYAVSAVEFALKDSPAYLTDQILVIDFGLSFSKDCVAGGDGCIPISYRAPETIFDHVMSIHSDIWALGCVLYEIRAGVPLFEAVVGGKDEVLLQMVQVLGKLPLPWWEAWETKHRYFDEDGHSKEGRPSSSLKTLIQEIGANDHTLTRPNPVINIRASAALSSS